MGYDGAMNAESRIRQDRLVPVIKITHPDQAVPLARALLSGGIGTAEITFRSNAAAEGIRRIHAEVPEILVGAGTVINADLARQAHEAGAGFVLSPGLNPRVVEYCQVAGIPIYPGVNNPSAIEAALEYGLRILKFFPAEASGGLAMLDALSGPYGQVEFIPTGGIGPNNLSAYLQRPFIPAIGGSWMVPGAAIEAGNWSRISELCAEARRLAEGTRTA